MKARKARNERYIVRAFTWSNSGSVHAGVFTDPERAITRANSIAVRAKRRGLNVSVTVRLLHDGSGRIDELLDAFEERPVFKVGSYGIARSDRSE